MSMPPLDAEGTNHHAEEDDTDEDLLEYSQQQSKGMSWCTQKTLACSWSICCCWQFYAGTVTRAAGPSVAAGNAMLAQ